MTDQPPRAQVYDPLEEDLRQLTGIGVDDIHLNLKDPKVAKYLAQQYKLRLLELISQRKTIVDLTRMIENLQIQREVIRVEYVQLHERERISIAEFPSGILLGLAGNILISDITNYLAWGILIFGILFFIIMRSTLIKKIFSREEKKGAK